MESKQIEELKAFVEHYNQNPSVLHTPPLAFFKNFLKSLGARIPAFGESSKDGDEYEDKKLFESKKPNVSMEMDDSSNDDNVESDDELDSLDVVEADNDPPQNMGDPSADVTKENQVAAQLLNAKAMEAIADGKFNEAIGYLTDAIMSNPKSAILYANRARIFIELKKPNAAIRDADAALQINPESTGGFKARGMAIEMLGLWEEAAHDLHVASKLDFDEIGQMLKKVKPNANKIEEHHQKYEPLHIEKELRKTGLERKRRRDADAASVLKDGESNAIHSGRKFRDNLNAPSETSRLYSLLQRSMEGPLPLNNSVFKSFLAKFPEAVFYKVDIDEAAYSSADERISSILCSFVVKNGVQVDAFIGVDKNALDQNIIDFLMS